jgi:hypothetical protein
VIPVSELARIGLGHVPEITDDVAIYRDCCEPARRPPDERQTAVPELTRQRHVDGLTPRSRSLVARATLPLVADLAPAAPDRPLGSSGTCGWVS